MVYDDEVLDGSWFCCSACQAAGDMIELAAAVWEMCPGNALQKLYRLDYPLPAEVVKPDWIESYLEHHLEYRRRLSELWTRVSKSPIRGYGQRHEAEPEMKRRHLAGLASVPMIEEAFAPSRVRSGNAPNSASIVGNRLFKGGGWKDAGILPYFDLPGRFSGFLFWRPGANPPDKFFQCVARLQGQGKKTKPPEAGLAWFPYLRHACQERTFFAINDPLIALQMHQRHFRVSGSPLPLTAWYDGPEARTTGKRPGREE